MLFDDEDTEAEKAYQASLERLYIPHEPTAQQRVRNSENAKAGREWAEKMWREIQDLLRKKVI